MTQDLTKTIAEAIYNRGGLHIEECGAIATEALQTIRDAGYAVAPVIPSDDTLTAAASMTMMLSADGYATVGRLYREGAIDVYRAMIQAAQEGK